MAFGFILLVLPALTLASIEVDISGKYSENATDMKVDYRGYDDSVISDTERTTFNVDDDSLKNAVRTYSGKRPVIVFVRNPWSPWGELEYQYQVYRVFVPRHGKIFEASTTPTIVFHQTFENNSTIPATYNVGISQFVVNRVWSSWRTSGELSGIKINYSIKIKVANVDGEPSFSYNSTWGQHTEESQIVRVGASSNIDITLQPGQAVVTQLVAKKEFVKVELEYDASLHGYIAVQYDDLYEGSYYHINPIHLCMKSAGLSNQKTSREFIDIEFFSGSKVVVRDLHQGHILMEVH